MTVEVPRDITRSLQDVSSLAIGGAHSAALDAKSWIVIVKLIVRIRLHQYQTSG
jgi:hypothetical protein